MSAPGESHLPLDGLTRRDPGAGYDLLAGVRVLDLTSSLAGPYGTMLLADLGAEVVKVERPGVGDDSRTWGPPFLDDAALWFVAVNRNKRSVTIDYSSAAGREVLCRLIGAADVLVTTLRRSSLERLGIDYQSARAVREDIIYCTISGYGQTGPARDLPGYDLIAEGVSGVMDLTGEPEQQPQKVGTPAADLLAGMDAAYSIVAALLDREHTGRGHQLDISLVESMTAFLTPKIVSFLGSGERQRRSGGRDSVIAVYQVFETADDPMTIALGNDRIFRRFCVAIDRSDLPADPGYATNAARREHRQKLVCEIQSVLRTRTRVEWLDIFYAADVPVGPINHLEDVVQNQHMIERELFYRIPVGRGIPQVNTSWKLDGEANGYRLPPPELGADTDELLQEWVNMSEQAIGLARAEGAL